MKKHPKHQSSPLITRLVTQATEYAEKHLRWQGHMPPMLHGVTSDNQFMLTSKAATLRITACRSFGAAVAAVILSRLSIGC